MEVARRVPSRIGTMTVALGTGVAAPTAGGRSPLPSRHRQSRGPSQTCGRIAFSFRLSSHHLACCSPAKQPSPLNRNCCYANELTQGADGMRACEVHDSIPLLLHDYAALADRD